MRRIGDGCGSDDEAARDADALDIIDDVDIGDDGIDDEGLSRRSEQQPDPPPRDDAVWVRGERREKEGAEGAAGVASSSSSADDARDDAASS